MEIPVKALENLKMNHKYTKQLAALLMVAAMFFFLGRHSSASTPVLLF
jgi:hypothetical protein